MRKIQIILWLIEVTGNQASFMFSLKVLRMKEENQTKTMYYRGKHKVKVVTKSEGYWIIEALEDFCDAVNGKEVSVKVGETRIVPAEIVYKNKRLPPPVKEHEYELKMEKELEKLIAEKEKDQGEKA